TDVPITETLNNFGNVAWTDWHERVVSTTTFSGTDTEPEFLFDHNTLSLSANYGSGVVALTQGVDYTISPTVYSGPSGSGNDGNWSAVDIFFAPGFAIAPGDQLVIQKSIFEVFLNSDVWNPGESAGISEYPTPEPASCVMALICAVPLLARRR
ncbi:MAG TPA: hypothetical protein VKK61_11750, partial [Tepidisphaeraceae bacterium]|nr:hypothetical protein [Tepidisphaeraceae bacterium]